MLKRVYVDNYRCFVNFELRLRQHQLIMGLNGTGKSTLLDALRGVQKLVRGDLAPNALFPYSTRTRWQTLPQQTFELDVDLGSRYRFRLELGSWGRPERTRIRKEVVLCDGQPVFEFIEGEVHLFNNEFQRRVTYPFDWFRSALATVQARPENQRLMQFKNWLEGLQCLELNPHAMGKLAEGEDVTPATDMSNFASWYRHISQERSDAASKLQEHLRQIVPGFESLNLAKVGESARLLGAQLSFPSPDNPRGGYPVAFDELSDGQRVLVCLYALLEFLVEGHACLFLDEPENYVAIPEIQPWLLELRDRLEERGGQVIIISHHPELINYLADDAGLVFERVGPGPVLVREFTAQQPLLASDRIARGWDVIEKGHS